MKMLSLVPAALAGLALFCCNPALGASCVATECHPGIAALKQPHAPVKDGECLSCHNERVKEHPIKGGKSFELAAKGGALCDQCHEPKGKKKVVHAPVKDGECTGCHQPHGASGRFLLNLSDDQTDLCMGCHDRTMMTQKFMHGPVAVGSCTECHDPHESSEKVLLKGTVRELCLKCHADFAKTLSESAVGHPPVKNGPCTSCHDPHGTPYTFFVKKKLPDLCTECHSNIGKKLASVKVPHKPVMAEGGCSNCHSAHYSKAKGLLPFDEMTTCLTCHDKDNLGKPALRNIKKEMAGKKFLHGPIKKGECKACHDPHGSDHYRMLRGPYPTELYNPYKEGMYDGCLRCHQKNLLRFPDTTVYTAFRNGNRNLHYVHVVNSRKGRSCRICHEPHASTGEKMISKEGAKFGDWKIPINFKITKTGGSCAPGCHREFKYDREKPQSYK
jgi:predicted CXXCH cytochrome family protein